MSNLQFVAMSDPKQHNCNNGKEQLLFNREKATTEPGSGWVAVCLNMLRVKDGGKDAVTIGQHGVYLKTTKKHGDVDAAIIIYANMEGRENKDHRIRECGLPVV